MTTNDPNEGTSVGAVLWTIVGLIFVLGLVICFITGWQPFDYRVSFDRDTSILITVTPLPTETPPPTDTPVPTLTPVVLAPFSGDEQHVNYRNTFSAAHKDLTDDVAILDMLVDQYAQAEAGDKKWSDTLALTCDSMAGRGKTWVESVWPPGPYNASNPLTDAHSRLAQAQLGAVLVCANLGSLGATDYDFSWPNTPDVETVRSLLGTTRTNLDYAMAGFNLDLYGPR